MIMNYDNECLHLRARPSSVQPTFSGIYDYEGVMRRHDNMPDSEDMFFFGLFSYSSFSSSLLYMIISCHLCSV